MHETEPVIRRVPQLLHTGERAPRPGRDLAHEGGRPARLRDPVARRVARVVRKTARLVVADDVIRAVVVRVVLRGGRDLLEQDHVAVVGRRAVARDRPEERVVELLVARGERRGRQALAAAGDTSTARRALVYLAVNQRPDGGFPQNFWIDGTPYWQGIQLDEVAFPILLAWRLRSLKALGDFDPYPMVLRGAAYLVRHGPATQQERWEEASGYSPSTLASNIAALVCAAEFARGRGEAATASYLEEYADFLEGHVEDWTVTTEGTLVPGVPRHYIRICPTDINNPSPDEDPNRGQLAIKNRPPGASPEPAEQPGVPQRLP